MCAFRSFLSLEQEKDGEMRGEENDQPTCDMQKKA